MIPTLNAGLGPADWALLIVTGLIVALFLTALAIQARGVRAGLAARRLRAAAPGLLVSLGMFGTFVGVAMGLYAFDPRAIETSLNGLFAGLQLAFVTSIVGIAGAIVLRVAGALAADESSRDDGHAPRVRRGDPSNDATLSQALLAAVHRQTETSAAVVQALRAGQAAAAAQHAEQLAAFRELAARIAEQGSATLVAALEQVIRDFNTQLGDAVGENFRRLDASVGRLLEWQERYREHLETLETHLTAATNGVSTSADAIERLTAQSQRLAAHIDEQAETLAAFRRESEALEALLRTVASLRTQAENAMPAFESRLVALLETLDDAVAGLARRSGSSHEPHPGPANTLRRRDADALAWAGGRA